MSRFSPCARRKGALGLVLALVLGVFTPLGCGPEGAGSAPPTRDQTQKVLAEEEKALEKSKTAGKTPFEGQNIKRKVMHD